MNEHDHLVGLTRDTGFQVGVRRTFSLPCEQAWELISSQAGVRIWLGDIGDSQLAKGMNYQLADGTHGEITVYEPQSHMRLSWQPQGWARASILQLRTLANGDRTVIAFHQEHLPGPVEREKRRAFFEQVFKQLKQIL